MAITDAGVPATSPHTMLSNLLTNNMASPDGVWTPSVNTGWLEFKKQNTYQIVITPVMADTQPANLTGGTTTAEPKISDAWFDVTLFAPTRQKCWDLYRKTMLVLNNETLTSPSAGINDYHWVRVVGGTQAGPALEFEDKSVGIDKDDSDIVHYRARVLVQVRWNE